MDRLEQLAVILTAAFTGVLNTQQPAAMRRAHETLTQVMRELGGSSFL